jgi:hypothetical protein
MRSHRTLRRNGRSRTSHWPARKSRMPGRRSQAGPSLAACSHGSQHRERQRGRRRNIGWRQPCCSDVFRWRQHSDEFGWPEPRDSDVLPVIRMCARVPAGPPPGSPAAWGTPPAPSRGRRHPRTSGAQRAAASCDLAAPSRPRAPGAEAARSWPRGRRSRTGSPSPGAGEPRPSKAAAGVDPDASSWATPQVSAPGM